MEKITFIVDRTKLDGTCYIEIVPGRYQQKHWQDGSLFFTEETFRFIEHIFEKYVEKYDHYSMQDIPKQVWLLVVDALKTLNRELTEVQNIVALSEKIYFYCDVTKADFDSDFEQNKSLLIQMNTDFIAWIEQTLTSYEYIAVLGI